MNYFYIQGDEVFGPVSDSEIRTLFVGGKIPPGTRVRYEDKQEWWPVEMLGDGQPPPSLKFSPVKGVDYYVTANQQKHGPYSFKQVQTMWLNGQLTGDALLEQTGKAILMAEYRKQLEEPKRLQENEGGGNQPFTFLLGLGGFVLGALFFLNGCYITVFAKSSIHEGVAAIYLGSGAVLGVLSPLLATIARKR